MPSASGSTSSGVRITVDLVPKSVLDPFASTARTRRIVLDGLRETPRPADAEGPSTVMKRPKPGENDIEFCDRLFEIPSLRGINVAQVVAGTRTSFVRTADGRVLAWGANEHGCVILNTLRISRPKSSGTQPVGIRLDDDH